MIRLYNTKTRTKVDFETLERGKVGMYVCGPTVYNYIHIGNARTFISFDVIRRYLMWRGFDVTFVQNVTDVDDKIIGKSLEEGRSAAEVAAEYTEAFIEDMRAAGVLDPDIRPKATEEIPAMIELIQELIDGGHAYDADGDVYFNVRSFPAYGELSGRNVDEMESGHRELRADGKGVEDRKRDPLDFALWKAAKPGEPAWESPWGMGRPGWHIECSCISMKYLGEHLDIHCGGIDNAFPHHTNEIAQSEAYLGHPWCKYWVHIHHLNTNSGKMSKSKGEFLTVSLLEEKGYDPLVYRFFCLQSHYRKGLVFSWENLDNAKAAYDKLVARVAALSGEGTVDEGAVERFKNDFLEAVGNDLNTSLGVTALYDVLKAGVNDATKRATLDSFDQVLGLELLSHADALKAQQAAPVEGAEEIEALIAKRLEAKRAKNWAEADAIRDQLRAMGVEIKDGKDGTTWTRI